MARPKGTQQIIDAIVESHGKVTLAAKLLGYSRKHIYSLAKEYPEIQQALDDSRNTFDESLLDTAESNLQKALEKNEVWATRYVLDKKGQSRGYVDRQEITGANGNELVIKVVYDDYNPKTS